MTAILLLTSGADVAVQAGIPIAVIYIAGSVWLQRREDREDADAQGRVDAPIGGPP
jgi:hypothetical protein